MTTPTPNGPRTSSHRRTSSHTRTSSRRRTGSWAAAAAVLALAALVAAVVQVGTAPPAAPLPPDAGVANYARELQGEVLEPLPPGQEEGFEHGPDIGGCAIGYGLNGECVPSNFPPYVADTYSARCAWLEAQGAGALEVPGADRHGLVPAGAPVSPRGNPYACPEVLRPAEGVAPP